MLFKNMSEDTVSFLEMNQLIAQLGIHCSYLLFADNKLDISDLDKEMLAASIRTLEELDNFCEKKYKKIRVKEIDEAKLKGDRNV